MEGREFTKEKIKSEYQIIGIEKMILSETKKGTVMTNEEKIYKYQTAMLIDDSEVDNFINQKLLEKNSFAKNVYVHTSSKSALELLSSLTNSGFSAEGLLPEVIFLDISMPIMDGFQFIKEFEKIKKNLKKDLKIVLLTSSNNPEDFERSQVNSSVNCYINKPLAKDILVSI